jgi:flagellum-specific peptidoglycan hydrolase FlgJ
MYVLSVGMLFMMGTDFNTRGNIDDNRLTLIPMNMYNHSFISHYIDFQIAPIIHPLLVKPSVSRQHTVQKPIIPIHTKTTIVAENNTSQYQVTSHYLNVRANKNAASEVINVVKNGDILEILSKTDNNWLKLKSGGYVHGNYAKLINKSSEQLSSISSGGNEIVLEKPNKPSSSVNSESKLTEQHIEQIFEGTSLADHGLEQTILQTEEDYGINAYFTIAVMKLESGHGKSKLAKEKNNLFGLNAIDGDAFNKAFSFQTKGESVEKFGQIISKNYIDKGYTSIEKVATKYCQANPKWSALITKIMKNDYKKLEVSMK